MKEINNNGITISKLEIDVNDNGHITNCYFINDKDNNLVLIDPAADSSRIINTINENHLDLKAVILTHAHADHICALTDIIKKYPKALVYVHMEDKDSLNDKNVNCEETVQVKVPPIDMQGIIGVLDGDTLNIGEIQMELIHTPGHTGGSICILEKTSQILFTGDTIFSNTYGRTDLLTGSSERMHESLEKIFARFDNMMCLPGHGEEFILKDVKKKIRLLFSYKR